MAGETLFKVKNSLRISHSKLDVDISDTITACLLDLRMCGIAEPQETDPLILRAIKLYCHGHFTDDMAKGNEYLKRYDQLKATLMMATGYGAAPDEEAAESE